MKSFLSKYSAVLFLIAILLLFLSCGKNSNPVNTDSIITFEKIISGANNYSSQSLYETSDGGYIVTGAKKLSDSTNYDVYLLKIDKYGNIVWEKIFGGEDSDWGLSVCETSDRGLIITGITYDGTSQDIYLIKTNSNGNLIWEKKIGKTDLNEQGYCVSETSDGGYIITGSIASSEYNSKDVYLIKTDNNGNLLWEKTFGGEYVDIGYSICKTLEGDFIITGVTSNVNGSNLYLIKTNKDGNLLWEKKFGGAGFSIGYSITETIDHDFIISGAKAPTDYSSSDVYVIKTDNNGYVIWEKTFSNEVYDAGYDISCTTDGGYIITGLTNTILFDDVYLLKIDYNGNVMWDKTFGTVNNDVGCSVCQSSDNGYIITGRINTVWQDIVFDIYLIKTDSRGNVF